MFLNYQDYRNFLKDELNSRIQVNSRYSLRAFARDLGVSPQRLSLVINGKTGLSVDAAMSLAARLNLTDQEKSHFCDLVQYLHSRSSESKRIAAMRLASKKQTQGYSSITLDSFRVISDWYHYALLELTTIKGFKSDPKWIADRLGISMHEANGAIERLTRLELLEEKSGKLRRTSENATSHDIPSDAIKKFNDQILRKALEALKLQTVDERDFTTMTLATSKKKLKEAKLKIREFGRELTQFMEADEKEEVYMLAIQLFRLTQPGGNK